MHADSFECQCDIDSVIDEKLRSARSRHGLHLMRKCHKLPRREIAFTELNRRRHGIHYLLQKGNQRAPVGLMTIRDDKKPAGECQHQGSAKYTCSPPLLTSV